MYNIRLEESSFIFSHNGVDKYQIKGNFEDGYVVYNSEEEAVYNSISFEACVTWIINS